MNMDRDFQPIIGCYLTDLTHIFICTLSHLIKNKSLCVTDLRAKGEQKLMERNCIKQSALQPGEKL